MNGKRTKQLRKLGLSMGLDLYTIQIKGQGIPNLFRKMKKDYQRRENANLNSK